MVRLHEIENLGPDYTILALLQANKKEIRTLYISITDRLSVLKNPYRQSLPDVNNLKLDIIDLKNRIDSVTNTTFNNPTDPDLVQIKIIFQHYLDDVLQRASELNLYP